MLDGDPPILPEPLTRAVSDTQEARQAVEEYALAGYDLIKVRDRLSAEVYLTIVAAARAPGLDVDGHLPRSTGLPPDSLPGSGQTGLPHVEVLGYLTAGTGGEEVRRLTELVRDRGIHATTTLIVFPSILAHLRNLDSLLGRPELRYVHPLFLCSFWEPPSNPYQGRYDSAGLARLEAFHDFVRRMTKSLHAAGVAVLLGTDALNPMIIPGFSVVEELKELVSAGLTPLESLQAATAQPASRIRGLDDAGVVSRGKRADLLLLNENSLEDVGRVSGIAGVMVNGVWLARSGLDRGLAEAERSVLESGRGTNR